jgi:CYTH domain-containing protein
MPISRRFLVPSSVVRLFSRDRGADRVQEGYFANQAGRSSHVTLVGENGMLVLETETDGLASEERTEIPRPHAEALLDVAPGTVEFVRTRLFDQGCDVLLDGFVQPDRFQVATVICEDAESVRRFRPPLWFGTEVTASEAYHNRSIALQGPPPIQDVPLSNRALDQCLDVLEGAKTHPILLDAVEEEAAVEEETAAEPEEDSSETVDALRRFASAFNGPPGAAPERPVPEDETAAQARPPERDRKAEEGIQAAVPPTGERGRKDLERSEGDDAAIRALAWSLRPRSSRRP